MQQGLLICCGTIVAALPALMAAHSFIVVLWLWAVKRLDNMHGAELERMHEIPEDEPDALSVAAA
jgi:AAA family ATP:ADP antiporter